MGVCSSANEESNSQKASPRTQRGISSQKELPEKKDILEQKNNFNPENWRSESGFICTDSRAPGIENTLIFLSYFVDHNRNDGTSPLPDKKLLTNNEFVWGAHVPFEKVVESEAHLKYLIEHPVLFRNAVAIVEPWEHVGNLPDSEQTVRASSNVAYAVQRLADCDSFLIPFWRTGLLDLDQMTTVCTSSLAVVFEGGAPSVYDPETFKHPEYLPDDPARYREEVLTLTEQIILNRTAISGPAIFICLGHQLAAEAHIRLIRRVVKHVLHEEEKDNSKHVPQEKFKELKEIVALVHEVGKSIKIEKEGKIVCEEGYEAANFAVWKNECSEVGQKRLQKYKSPEGVSYMLDEILKCHQRIASAVDGIIETLLDYNKDITMFHGDEVNGDAILFANWAYQEIYKFVFRHRLDFAGTSYDWLLRLPSGIEILCSTELQSDCDASVVQYTEVAASCICYSEPDMNVMRRSFTMQFHPELFADLNDMINRESEVSFQEYTEDDGVKILSQLLVDGINFQNGSLPF